METGLSFCWTQFHRRYGYSGQTLWQVLELCARLDIFRSKYMSCGALSIVDLPSSPLMISLCIRSIRWHSMKTSVMGNSLGDALDPSTVVLQLGLDDRFRCCPKILCYSVCVSTSLSLLPPLPPHSSMFLLLVVWGWALVLICRGMLYVSALLRSFHEARFRSNQNIN